MSVDDDKFDECVTYLFWLGSDYFFYQKNNAPKAAQESYVRWIEFLTALEIVLGHMTDSIADRALQRLANAGYEIGPLTPPYEYGTMSE